MRSIIVVSFLLLVTAPVSAEYIVCGNGPRDQCANTVGVTNIFPSRDPSTVADVTCSVVPDGQVNAQKTLFTTVSNQHENGRCHLKIVSGLMVEMTQPEKDAVNTAIQVIKNEQAAHAAEAADPACTKATQAEIDNFFQKQWDDPANTNDFKGDIDALTTNTAAAIRTTLTAITQRMLGVNKKIAKCERAKGG